MSRYTLSETPEVVVGWDDPLGEFFGHVYDADGDCIAETAVLDLVELELWLLVVPNLQMSDNIRASLLNDLKRHDEWRPGPLQKQHGFTGRHDNA